jgi:hypothetical protein
MMIASRLRSLVIAFGARQGYVDRSHSFGGYQIRMRRYWPIRQLHKGLSLILFLDECPAHVKGPVFRFCISLSSARGASTVSFNPHHRPGRAPRC